MKNIVHITEQEINQGRDKHVSEVERVFISQIPNLKSSIGMIDFSESEIIESNTTPVLPTNRYLTFKIHGVKYALPLFIVD